MTNDPATQLAILRQQRDAVTDPAVRAALDSGHRRPRSRRGA